MAEAYLDYEDKLFRFTSLGSYSVGQVIQLANGEAAFFEDRAASSGDPTTVRRRGVITVLKTSGIVILKGGEVWWDHSANVANYKKVSDRDFFVGTAAADATSTSTELDVILNQKPVWDIDISRDTFDTVYVGTQGLNTMGVFRRGGAHKFILSSTNEAQKMDIFSRDRFAVGANAIIEACFTVNNDGAGSNTDVSIGVSNGTHASDFETVAEFVVLHLDGAATAINLASDDGTTDVNPTDTTLTYTEGSAVANRVYLWIDMRDPADVQCYVNGALALDGTAFNVNAATGPFGLIAHIEKSSSADVYELDLEYLRCRFCEQ